MYVIFHQCYPHKHKKLCREHDVLTDNYVKIRLVIKVLLFFLEKQSLESLEVIFAMR